jgi:flagellar motor switch/type III secretory pathway protein FliN
MPATRSTAPHSIWSNEGRCVTVALEFGPPEDLPDGRSLRRAHFVPRSGLPLAAVCVVAGGVREELARLLATDVETEAGEPALPDAAGREVLFAGAHVYRVRGHACDAFVIARPADARGLVGAAFGEAERSESAPLSAIERATLERLMAALVALCVPLCGTVRSWERELPARAALDAETYFDVRAGGGVRATLGFALSRDPAESVGEPFTFDELHEVEVPCSVEFARGRLGVPAFARLAPGSTLALETRCVEPGRLFAGGAALFAGRCGARDGRAAFVVGG